ncbi:MAG TPA: hypothetical protein PK293_11925 [Spirochaetota bacterium]|nr:hypothetical protein [Spirochaetota bacterium]HPF06734.1 hypothetical protein [Spirochaetota bacterium]HPJ43316.1 hypothetical protein [Spirochaetota bacterium]HPR39231.1 hypothetical protein [Spirochaetota bacterium]
MINRKDLIKSVFNKKNILNAIDNILPVDLPEPEPVFDMPELTGDMLYYEAMKLGIDPSTLPADELKKAVIAEMVKTQQKQAPSESGQALAGDSVNG